MNLYLLMLIIFASTLFIFVLIGFFYMLWDRNYRVPNYIKAFIFQKSGGLSIVWVKKSETRGKQKIAENKRYGDFIYYEKDLFTFNHYKAGFFSEECITSLEVNLTEGVKPPKKTHISIDLDKTRSQLDFITNVSLHPKSLNDVLDTKLLAELTAKDLDLKVIITLIILILLVIGLIAVYMKVDKTYKAVESVQLNLSAIGQTIQNMNIRVK